MALAGVEGDSCPDARRALRLERVGLRVPPVPVADDGGAARARRPHGEAHAGVVVHGVRAELLPETLVPSFADQVEVELSRQAHRAVSIIRTSPTTGIEAQSGRLRAS